MSVASARTARETPSAGLARRGMRVIGVALRSAPVPFAVGIGGALLYAGMTVVAALVLGWATDEVVLPMFAAGRVELGLLLTASAAVVGVGALKAVGVVGRRLGAYVAQCDLQARYRRRVTRRYLDLPISWHRRHPTGELLSNANADVESAFFVAAPLPMAFGALALLAATGGLLVVTDPALAAVGFSVGPLLALANWYYQRRMRSAATLAQQARADVSEIAHESFDGALVVKTMGREEAETRRFAGVSERLRDRMIVVGRLRAFLDPVIEALPSVGILLVLLVGAYRVRAGALSAGDLVLFAYLFRLVGLPVRVFGWLLGELPRAVVGWERVSRVLTAHDTVAFGDRVLDGDGAAAPALSDVRFHYPSSEHEELSRDPDPALTTAGDVAGGDDGSRGIERTSFEVTAGRTVALVGATGSGKSTLASLLVRLYDPDEGSVTIDGHDLRSLARDQLTGQAAIVFQEAFLFDDSVRGNIALGLDVADDEVEAAARLAQAHEFVSALPQRYDTRVGERGTTLSGGQRQRIALARALVRRPRLLVLDDATSAVDPSVEADILEGLTEARLPSTVVVVAYRRASIVLADEVLFVEHGTITARGPHERLVREVPRYADLLTAYERRERDRDADDPSTRGSGP